METLKLLQSKLSVEIPREELIQIAEDIILSKKLTQDELLNLISLCTQQCRVQFDRDIPSVYHAY